MESLVWLDTLCTSRMFRWILTGLPLTHPINHCRGVHSTMQLELNMLKMYAFTEADNGTLSRQVSFTYTASFACNEGCSTPTLFQSLRMSTP